MKLNKIFSLFAAFSLLAVSCQHEEIWDKLNDHEQRIAQLEQLCRELNSNMQAVKVGVGVKF